MDDMTVELVYENRLARVVVDGYSRAQTLHFAIQSPLKASKSVGLEYVYFRPILTNISK